MKTHPAVKSTVIHSLTHYNVKLQDKNGRAFRQPKEAKWRRNNTYALMKAKPRHSACAERRGSGKMASLSDVKSKHP